MTQAAADVIPAPAQAAGITDSERKLTFIGVLIVFLLSALDQTIVSTAMPRIVSELHGLALYSWVTTAYLLTSTVMLPIWGKLSDILGRKPVLIAAIGFFLMGSMLSGLSGEFGTLPIVGNGMTQLVVFRAIQGIGGGGLFTIAFTIISDLYSPQERAKLGGMMGAVFGLSSAIGPLIGGFFTEHGTMHLLGHEIAGWRWVFYINMPLGLLSLFLAAFKMHDIAPRQADAKIDYLGAGLIIAIVVPLLLALTWGGEKHPWRAPEILSLLAFSGAALIAYIVAGRFTTDPILPLKLFRNRTFATVNLAGFLIMMSFISTAAFLPLFMQLAQGASATQSGLSILPLTAGIMISSIVSGQIAAKVGRYKPIILASVVLTGFAIWWMSRMTPVSTQLDVMLGVTLLGVGLGPSQSLFTLVLQDTAEPAQMGVVTSASQFFKQIGATIGVALFGTMLNGYLKEDLAKIMPGADLEQLRGMGAAGADGALALSPALREAIAFAVTHTFTLGIFVLVLALLATLLMPDVRMSGRKAKAPPPGH